MRRRDDQHDDDACNHAVAHVERPAIPQDAGADEHDEDVERERGHFTPSRLRRKSVGDQLVEQDGERLGVTRVVAQPGAGQLIELVVGGIPALELCRWFRPVGQSHGRSLRQFRSFLPGGGDRGAR